MADEDQSTTQTWPKRHQQTKMKKIEDQLAPW